MRFDFDEEIDRRHSGSIKWAGAEDELPMWVADMDFKAPPAVIEAFHKRIDHGVFGYCEPGEDWADAYISYYQDAYGWKIDKESLLFCTGVVPTISSSVRKLTSIGDEVIVLTPVYNIFFNSIVNNQRIPVEVPLHFDGASYSIDWAYLVKAMASPRAKLLIFCNPHNPVGRIWSKDELIRLAELAKAYGVIVLSDEIHGEITLPERPYVPFLTVSDTAKEVGYAAISPTKCFNLAGIQTSAIVIDNAEIRKKVNRQINTDEVAEPNVFAAIAPYAAFMQSRDWLAEMRKYVFENRAYAESFIEKEIPSIKAIHGKATYLLWVDCRKICNNGNELAEYLREHAKLRVSAGEAYGKGGEGFLRINLACPRSRVEEGMRRLKTGIESYKSFATDK